MKKLNFLSILLSALLVSGSVWAGMTPVSKDFMPQEKPNVTIADEPQPFQAVELSSSVIRRAVSRKLSQEALTNDQVTLKKNGIVLCDTNIVDAFKRINSNEFSASDSATIILKKNIDLALADYYDADCGVKLNAGKKAVLELNSYNFTSYINTGTGENNTGRNMALISNMGNLTIQDTKGSGKISFCEESAAIVTATYGGYISDAILEKGDLTIANCTIENTSYGNCSNCVDIFNDDRNVSLWIESGILWSKYSCAIRQYLRNSTYTSSLTLNGGELRGGGSGLWTQLPSSGAPVAYVNFNGGKVYGNYGSDQRNNNSYLTYTYGGDLSNVHAKFSGTEFIGGDVYLGSGGRNLTKGETITFLKGSIDGSLGLGASYQTFNFYGGHITGEVYTFSTRNSTINIYGGQIDGWVYFYKPHASGEGNGTINMTNGTVSLLAAYSHPHTTMNISGGYIYGSNFIYSGSGNESIVLYTSSSGNSYNSIVNISGEPIIDGYVYDYCGNNSTFNISGGLFWYSELFTLYSSYYISDESVKVKPKFDITGGYYRYDSYSDDNSSYCHGCTINMLDWNYAIHPGYSKIGDGITPLIENYYFTLGQEKKPEGIISPITKEILVYDTVKQEYIEPKATDNVILTKNDTIGQSGEDIRYGRDTIYLDTLNVNGLTFAGRDTIDVIANPGSVVVVGSSGIKASDTTTVYLTVEGGGTMKVGTEAIQKVDTVIVKSDASGNGTLLISPNAQLADSDRLATVKLYIDGARKVNDQYYVWQHIAVPTDGVAAIEVANDRKKDDPSFLSYVQWWNADLASENKWQQISSWEEMNHPWRGYILTTNSTSSNVTYSFTGNIIGNADGQLHFNSKGYNFFGNSYTAPIDVQTLINDISNGDDIEMTVWIYNAKKYRYVESNNLMRMFGMADFDEISSMQGFWLRNMTDSYGQDASVNYNNAVWSNPSAMGNPKVQAPARRHLAKDLGITTAQVIVSADGRQDLLNLFEGSNYTEGFDNGSDATKLIDDKFFNLYASTGAGDLACVATNNLAGTMLSFNAVKAGEYTLSFANVNGEEYALYDMQNGITTKITEGETYTFNAVAGKNEGRFMVTPIQGIGTNVGEVKKDAPIEGIYTVLGQFVAKTAEWANLPSGVYVVNGQKVVK